ncbi:MAG: DUF4105 domain-containing protein [Nitrospirae bacterium]|nr:MAG: DUF4105 domain-containing protein [Nitrospirota bacterium]
MRLWGSSEHTPWSPLPVSCFPYFLLPLLCFWCATFASWPVQTHASESRPSSYLDALIQRAQTLRLADQRYWHLLLHYRPTWTGAYESEVDDPGFFLAEDGKIDPSSELEATLRAFFRDEPVGRSKQPARCAFVARFEWLKRQLAIDETRLPVQSCDRFEQWLAEFHAKSVTLIFASAFMNNPSSMFGHTFLRIDQAGQTPDTRLLAYTINYAADVPPDVGIEYAFKGMSGGYRGYFSTMPYYMKVKEYRDLENRDLWEYRLNLSEEQIVNLLRHAWELGNAYFDYYFFKENCSYHLLSLLEVADPSLHLTDRFTWWTIPADTVRLLTSQLGLVRDVVYRPSRSTQIIRSRERFSPEENLWLIRILETPAMIQHAQFQALEPSRRVKVLDLASDILRYKIGVDPEDASRYRTVRREVLIARSRIPIPSRPLTIEPWTRQPEMGHGTSRLTLGVGWREDELFEEIAIRPAYHDLLDPEPGYTPGAQIEALALHVRHYATRNQVRIERFTLLDIVSLAPMDDIFRAPSWKIKIGQESLRRRTCRYCSNGNLNGGIGAAMQWSELGRPILFGFAELDANVSSAFQPNYRIGGGGTVGFLAHPHPRWGILITGAYLYFPLGERSDETRIFFGQRLTLAQHVTARLEYRYRTHDNEIQFSIQAFF